MRSIQLKSINLLLAFVLNVAVVLMLASCTKDETEPVSEEYPEYIIFGRYTTGSWCSGETCIETFKIDTKGIFENAVDNLPAGGAFLGGDFNMALTVTDYEQIIDLLEKHTYEPLFETTDLTLGNLLVDNFHYYFEYKSKTRHKSWVIDGSFDGSVPQSITPLLIDLNQMVQIAQF